MSLQAIRNALYNQLVTCGPYAACEVSACSFTGLETVASCALVFMPGSTTFREMTGTATTGGDEKNWGIQGSVYIRDISDPQRLLSLCWQAPDDLYNTLSKDRTLGGAADNAFMISTAFDPNRGIQAGGALWAEIKFTIKAVEYAYH